jgi:hypothetical protein
VLFQTHSGDATIWITRDGLVYQFTRRLAASSVGASDHQGEKSSGMAFGDITPASDGGDRGLAQIEQLLVKATFTGASANAEALGQSMQDHKCNYFLGNDPARWRADVPNYSTVLVKGVYPGVDIHYSSAPSGQVAYEFVAASTSARSQISVQYEGAGETSVNADGLPVFRTPWGHEIDCVNSRGSLSGVLSPRSAPSAQDGERRAAYQVASAVSSPAAMDIEYSTLFGGSAAEVEDIVVDATGAAYVTGETTSPTFPTVNAYQSTQGGVTDAFVSKVSSTGSSLIYSTYLGGSGGDWGWAITVHSSGAAFVTGWASSSNFPTVNAYQGTNGGIADIFVARLSSAGNSLEYSTYLGGEGTDVGDGIAVSASGSAFVTGYTQSPSLATSGVHQTFLLGGQDCHFSLHSSHRFRG